MSMQDFLSKLEPWGKFKIIRGLKGGYRNSIYLVENADACFVAKTTRRSQKALEWLEAVYEFAITAGFITPKFMKSMRGNILEEGVTLESFIEGEPIDEVDKAEVARGLECFHSLTRGFQQRPDFASSIDLLLQTSGGDVELSSMPEDVVRACRQAWRALQYEATSIIHGDPNPANILKTREGGFALIDWDEARVDISLLDRYGLLKDRFLFPEKAKLERAALAWEIAICWHVEPEYAKRLLKRFL